MAPNDVFFSAVGFLFLVGISNKFYIPLTFMYMKILPPLLNSNQISMKNRLLFLLIFYRVNSNGQVKLTWNAGTYTPSTTTTEKPTTGHHYNPYSMHVMKPHGHHGKFFCSLRSL